MISVNRNYREITIEKWIYQEQPTAIYQTVISQESGNEKVNVTNTQPLIIPFDELFLRLPGHTEHDIVFNTENWREYARNV